VSDGAAARPQAGVWLPAPHVEGRGASAHRSYGVWALLSSLPPPPSVAVCASSPGHCSASSACLSFWHGCWRESTLKAPCAGVHLIHRGGASGDVCRGGVGGGLRCFSSETEGADRQGRCRRVRGQPSGAAASRGRPVELDAPGDHRRATIKTSGTGARHRQVRKA
jgi:hypothetical protein